MSAAPVLTVLDGVQSGARMRLGEGETPIGSGTDCAVVIADPDIQLRHFEIRVVGATTLLRALRTLQLSDGQALRPGEESVIAAPTVFSAGTTRFLLDVAIPAVPANDPTAVKAPRNRRTPIAVAGAAAAMLAGLGLFACARLVTPASPPTAGVTAGGRVAGSAVTDLDAASSALRARLRDVGLAGIAVSAMHDGTLTATGLLPPSDQATWEGVRQWFDARYGSSPVIVEDFAAPGSMPPLKLAAVWTGPGPYVVDGSGDRLHVGGSAGDGWVIERIMPDRVAVRRGTQHVELKY